MLISILLKHIKVLLIMLLSQHNNLNDLFPENDKIHKMKTRAVEKYKVQHANKSQVKSVKLGKTLDLNL